MDKLLDEVIEILTKLKIENYYKHGERKLKLTEMDLFNFSIKMIKIIKENKEE